MLITFVMVESKKWVVPFLPYFFLLLFALDIYWFKRFTASACLHILRRLKGPYLNFNNKILINAAAAQSPREWGDKFSK